MHVLLAPHNLIRVLQGILFAAFFLVAAQASAANLVISPNSGTYNVGEEVTITVEADPQGESVNAVEAILAFDNTKFEVISTSEVGSVFTLWTTRPFFSNNTGTIEFGGGSQTPFSSSAKLVSVTLRAIAGGSGRISVSNASVLAADGQNTEVYSGSKNAAYTLIGDTAVQDTDSDTEVAVEDRLVPVISSTVYTDPEAWYATKTGTFTWKAPTAVTKVAVEVSASPDAEPLTVYDPPISEIALTPEIVNEGVQYLHIQYKDESEWRDILHRKIQIDTISPEPFIVGIAATQSETGFPTLSFEAQDASSGIQRYELKLPNGEVKVVTPEEATSGYQLADLIDGTYTISVTAYDKAGNFRESSATIPVTAGWIGDPEGLSLPFMSIFMGKNLIILTLILIIIALLIHASAERQLNLHTEEKLRKETHEVQEQMEKIFSALRDEIYDQINMISKHAKLSKKEQEAVAGLNQALEVSETLIEKEIGDVTQILNKKKTRVRKPRAKKIVDTPIAPK